jgi:hypothetical protein
MAKTLDEDYPINKETLSNEESFDKIPKEELSNPTEVYDFGDPAKSGQYPTELVDLPSKGLTYDTKNPLSKGKLELKYMTSKEEDILTSPNLVKKNVALDKVLQQLIVTDINYNDLLLGDRNALIVAARVMAYGKEYNVELDCPKCGVKQQFIIDLTSFNDKDIDYSLLNRENKYEFILPFSKVKIGFKLLTINDDKHVEQELKGLKKINENSKIKAQIDPEMSTRMKYLITSVNGNTEDKIVRNFVEVMLTRDTLEFRKHLAKMTPNLDMSYDFECADCEYESKSIMPMLPEFFWPKSDV